MGATRARAFAFRVLKQVRSRDAWVAQVLDAELIRENLEDRDRAFATRLIYTTVQSQGTLDEVLDRHIPRPRDVHPNVRDAMRLSACELLFFDSPSSAAVDQGVELVKSTLSRAGGFANAVLRKVAAEKDSFPWGDPATDVAALARFTTHPTWLTKRLCADLGMQTARTLLEADNLPAPLWVAHNPFKGSFDELMAILDQDGAQPVAFDDLPGCIECAQPARAINGQALLEGRCVVADAAAQMVAGIVTPVPGSLVLEAAAGRGTKTLQIQAAAVAAGAPAELIAVDIHAFKTALLKERMQVLGVPGVKAVTADATDRDMLSKILSGRSADLITIDAPCSGLGTLRRRSEKRWRIEPEDIDRLADLGGKMLKSTSHLVAQGGFVVYSTCTVTHEENDGVINTFLSSEEGKGFASVEVSDCVPQKWHRFITPDGYFQSIPEPGGADGHFVAVLHNIGVGSNTTEQKEDADA